MVEVPARRIRRWRGLRREKEYDREHGVDTAGIISPARLILHSGVPINGYSYQGCDPVVTVAALQRLPIDCTRFTFLDFGSGKGRTLICAREFNFRKYVGVEFAPSLCETARRNNLSLKTRHPGYPDWEIICADAGTYEFSGPTVLCMYNPFGAEVMSRVIARARKQTELYIIYFNATLAHLWEEAGFRVLHSESDYRIYTRVV